MVTVICPYSKNAWNAKELIWAHALATILPILAAIISFHINTQLTGTSHYKSPTADTDQWAVCSLLLFCS
jgi:hypothetical protein